MRMCRLKLAKWTAWAHAVTVTAAILTLLLASLTVDLGIDHRIEPVQSANELVTDAGIVGAHSGQTTSNTDCHFGHSCLALIAPSSGLVLLGLVEASVRPIDPHFNPFGVGYLSFQPPRILSQV